MSEIRIYTDPVVRAFSRPPVVCDQARPAPPLGNLRKLRFPMGLAWGELIIFIKASYLRCLRIPVAFSTSVRGSTRRSPVADQADVMLLY